MRSSRSVSVVTDFDKKIIKLAHSRPELQKGLRPLLEKIAMRMNPGSGFEDEKKLMRYHRYMSSLRVTDLTNAGKRGKNVDQFALYDLDMGGDPKEVDAIVAKIVRAKTYKEALKLAKDWLKKDSEVTGFAKIQETTEKGVRVTPAGFKELKIDGDNIYIESGYTTFVLRDKVDKTNEPTCIPAAKGSKTSVKAFYAWAKENLPKLKKMTYQQALKSLSKAGVKYHDYCAMD
jgi:hypothetical protein